VRRGAREGAPLASTLHWSGRMDRTLQLARAALESSGDVGLALSMSLIALKFLWLQARHG